MTELATTTRRTAERRFELIQLTAQGARERLEHLRDLTEQAKTEGDDRTLGYASWTDYLADALGAEPMRLPREQRQELVSYLAGEGMPAAAIAPIAGVHRSTIDEDIKQGAEIRTLPEKVMGRDGKEYSRPEPRVAPIPRDLPKPPTPELTEEDRRVIERQAADTRRWIRTAEAVVTIWSISGPWMDGFDEANLSDPIFADTWNTDFLTHARDNLEQLIEWSKNR